MEIENKDKQAFATKWKSGLTKREYFAAMAMQGLCSTGNYSNGQDMAYDAVRAADALLEELAK